MKRYEWKFDKEKIGSGLKGAQRKRRIGQSRVRRS